jgi:outer membrane protein assembly factor BamB
MSTHDDLDILLPELDSPASPDPEFASRLRQQFVSAAGHQPTARPRPVPVQSHGPEPIRLRPPRRRWLDLAAVAVLLLSMIGGLTRAGTLVTGGTPTPAIHVPNEEQPAMISGSAAMDGTVRGSPPETGEYRFLWSYRSGTALPFRDKIYALASQLGPTYNPQGVIALDAKTGAELWYQPVSYRFGFAVTSAGVVVGMTPGLDTRGSPAANGSIWDFHVVLLDLDTGEPIWRSAETYQMAGAAFLMSAQVATGSVVFVDGQMTLVAVDLSTGRERWRVESSAPPPADCAGPRFRSTCVPAGPAIIGDTVYIDNPATGQIVAVSLSTGEQKWAVDDLLERSAESPLEFGSVSILAVEQGVVVSSWPDSGVNFHFHLLSAADGSLLWQWRSDRLIWDVVRAGDAVVVLSSDAGQDNWRLERVAIMTGDVVQTSAELPSGGPNAYLQSLPDVDLVMLVEPSQGTVGFDAETLAVKWRQPSSLSGCLVRILPVLPDGNVACLSPGGIEVHRRGSDS